ncbi:MAG TPA: hypothetical protein VNO43_17855, partial [Candidatus Eisenbacteria bacterium]|nr:hypothetical protein [Candidatus Eisenbacteria bacterium]
QVQARLNGVHVNDRRAFKGNVTGELQLSVPTGGASPVRAMRGNGRLEARDGELTNVDLTKRIEQITGLIGMAKEQRDGVTTFKKQGRIVVPLKITGPAKGPSVNVDSQKLATNGLGQLFEERGKGLPVDRLFKSK